MRRGVLPDGPPSEGVELRGRHRPDPKLAHINRVEGAAPLPRPGKSIFGRTRNQDSAKPAAAAANFPALRRIRESGTEDARRRRPTHAEEQGSRTHRSGLRWHSDPTVSSGRSPAHARRRDRQSWLWLWRLMTGARGGPDFCFSAGGARGFSPRSWAPMALLGARSGRWVALWRCGDGTWLDRLGGWGLCSGLFGATRPSGVGVWPGRLRERVNRDRQRT